jgi:ATP-dependent Clp protease ATP-binding subunit ClpC
VDLDKARDRVIEATKDAPETPKATGSPPFTPRCKKCLELALREALQLGHNYIGTEHMLLGMIREGEGIAAQILVMDFGLALSEVRQEVIQLLSGYAGRAQKVEPAPRVVKPTLTEQEAFDLINWIDAFDTINGLSERHPLRMLRDKLT